MPEIITFNPERELQQIARERHEVEHDITKERLDELREQIEINRLFLAKVITALAEVLENKKESDRPLTPHQLWAIVTRERKILRENNTPTDEVLLGFIREGVRALIKKRQEITQVLATYEPRRVLAMLKGYSFGSLADDPDYDEDFDFVERNNDSVILTLDQVIPADLKFNIEMGVANYNVFISHEEAKRVGLDFTASGYAHNQRGLDESFSVIFKASHPADKILFASLFGQEKNYYNKNTLQHENQHQIDYFIRDLGGDFYQSKEETRLHARQRVITCYKHVVDGLKLGIAPMTAHNLQSLEAAIEKSGSTFPDGYDEWQQEAISSEAGNDNQLLIDQFQTMFAPVLNEKEQVEEKLFNYDFLKHVRTELLAHLRSDLAISDLQERLMVDYFLPREDKRKTWSDQYKMNDEENPEKLSEAAQQTRGIIETAVQAMTKLLELGYSREEIANLLTFYPLEKWQNIARSQRKVVDKIAVKQTNEQKRRDFLEREGTSEKSLTEITKERAQHGIKIMVGGDRDLGKTYITSELTTKLRQHFDGQGVYQYSLTPDAEGATYNSRQDEARILPAGDEHNGLSDYSVSSFAHRLANVKNNTYPLSLYDAGGLFADNPEQNKLISVQHSQVFTQMAQEATHGIIVYKDRGDLRKWRQYFVDNQVKVIGEIKSFNPNLSGQLDHLMEKIIKLRTDNEQNYQPENGEGVINLLTSPFWQNQKYERDERGMKMNTPDTIPGIYDWVQRDFDGERQGDNHDENDNLCKITGRLAKWQAVALAGAGSNTGKEIVFKNLHSGGGNFVPVADLEVALEGENVDNDFPGVRWRVEATDNEYDGKKVYVVKASIYGAAGAGLIDTDLAIETYPDDEPLTAIKKYLSKMRLPYVPSDSVVVLSNGGPGWLEAAMALAYTNGGRVVAENIPTGKDKAGKAYVVIGNDNQVGQVIDDLPTWVNEPLI